MVAGDRDRRVDPAPPWQHARRRTGLEQPQARPEQRELALVDEHALALDRGVDRMPAVPSGGRGQSQRPGDRADVEPPLHRVAEPQVRLVVEDRHGDLPLRGAHLRARAPALPRPARTQQPPGRAAADTDRVDGQAAACAGARDDHVAPRERDVLGVRGVEQRDRRGPCRGHEQQRRRRHGQRDPEHHSAAGAGSRDRRRRRPGPCLRADCAAGRGSRPAPCRCGSASCAPRRRRSPRHRRRLRVRGVSSASSSVRVPYARGRIRVDSRRGGRERRDRRRLAVPRPLRGRPCDPGRHQQPDQPRRHVRGARRHAAADVARRARPLAPRRLHRRAPARRAAAHPARRGEGLGRTSTASARGCASSTARSPRSTRTSSWR